MKKTFYRVCNPDSQQGLWYDFNGKFVGLIHEQFDFCTNSKLAMDFDEELVGWLSATESLDDLWKWFTIEDVKELQKHGWYIHSYEATEYRFYDRFQHMVIAQESSILISRIEYTENLGLIPVEGFFVQPL